MGKGTKVFLTFASLIVGLLVLAIATWPSDKLKLVACDVGQGDAILAIHGNYQVLVDGGPGRDVVDCLSRYVPFWDRTIEVVVITHPQKDHFGGIIDVMERYRVETMLSTGLDAESEEWEELEDFLAYSSTKVIYADSETEINLGNLNLDVVWPTSEFLVSIMDDEAIAERKESNVLGVFTSNVNANNASIVVHLKFGEFDALLTGDIEPDIIDDVVAAGEVEDVEYLKVPHHGSRNGLSLELLFASTPEYAVISSGKNPWGHPHKEILDMLEENNIKIYQTLKQGDIILETDGVSIRFY